MPPKQSLNIYYTCLAFRKPSIFFYTEKINLSFHSVWRFICNLPVSSAQCQCRFLKQFLFQKTKFLFQQHCNSSRAIFLVPHSFPIIAILSMVLLSQRANIGTLLLSNVHSFFRLPYFLPNAPFFVLTSYPHYYITLSHPVFLVLINLAVLRNIDQVFYRMSLSWDLSIDFLMSRLNL